MENNTMQSLLKNKETQTKSSNFPTQVGKFCFLLIILIINKNSKAQNLVPNASFEFKTICPYSDGQSMPTILNNPPWQSTMPLGGSTDTWDTCSFYNCNCGDFTCNYEFNFFGKQKPRTGSGMTGLYLHDGGDTSDIYYCKEYMQVKLQHQLQAWQRYWVSFYVSLQDSSIWGIDKIQAYFSDTLVMYENWVGIGLPSHYMFHPQVSNPEFNIITDTVNWVKIEGSFVATGTERFLIIGNFAPTYQTHSIMIQPTLNGYPISSMSNYYFFDDIAVYPDSTPVYPTNIGNDTCIYGGDILTLGAPSRAEYLYQWYDGSGNLIDTSGSITVSPTQTTTYVLVQKDFKFEETRDTINVTVGNCTPIPDYSNFEFDIYPNPCNGQVKVRFNTKVPDGAVLQLYDMIGQKVSEYPLTGIENIASVNLGNLATAIYHATVLVPDGFRRSVKLVIIR